MATVVAEMTMSLDGFVADPSDGVQELFGWYDNGDVAVPTADPERWTWHTSEASAGHLRDMLGSIGAVVSGRRMFDITGGWSGRHPLGVPVVVVTHSVPDGWPRDDAPFTFVTDGVESAVTEAESIAGDRVVGVGGADIAQQCLDAGLLDEVHVNLAPVLLGEGIRFFDKLSNAPIELDGPKVIEGTGVTHLYYSVRSPDRAATQ
jgi:dihydrofolate reductase